MGTVKKMGKNNVVYNLNHCIYLLKYMIDLIEHDSNYHNNTVKYQNIIESILLNMEIAKESLDNKNGLLYWDGDK